MAREKKHTDDEEESFCQRGHIGMYHVGLRLLNGKEPLGTADTQTTLHTVHIETKEFRQIRRFSRLHSPGWPFPAAFSEVVL